MFYQSGQRNMSSNALVFFSLALAAKGLLHNLLIQLRVLAVSLKGCRWMNWGFFVVARLKSAFTFYLTCLCINVRIFPSMKLNYCSWKVNDSKRFPWASNCMNKEIPELQKA